MIQSTLYHDEEDSLFIPIARQRNQRKTIKRRKSSKFNTSIWSFAQNQKYVQFLMEQRETMQSPQERKQSKVFVKMSQFLKGRSPEQCRSHHQKIMRNYLSLQNIIQNLLKVKEARITHKTFKKEISQNQQKDIVEIPILQISQFKQMEVPLSQISSLVEDTAKQLQQMWGMINENVWLSS